MRVSGSFLFDTAQPNQAQPMAEAQPQPGPAWPTHCFLAGPGQAELGWAGLAGWQTGWKAISARPARLSWAGLGRAGWAA